MTVTSGPGVVARAMAVATTARTKAATEESSRRRAGGGTLGCIADLPWCANAPAPIVSSRAAAASIRGGLGEQAPRHFEAGVELERPLELGARPVAVAEAEQRAAEERVRGGVVRVPPQRQPVMLDALGEAADAGERAGEVLA